MIQVFLFSTEILGEGYEFFKISTTRVVAEDGKKEIYKLFLKWLVFYFNSLSKKSLQTLIFFRSVGLVLSCLGAAKEYTLWCSIENYSKINISEPWCWFSLKLIFFPNPPYFFSPEVKYDRVVIFSWVLFAKLGKLTEFCWIKRSIRMKILTFNVKLVIFPTQSHQK